MLRQIAGAAEPFAQQMKPRKAGLVMNLWARKKNIYALVELRPEKSEFLCFIFLVLKKNQPAFICFLKNYLTIRL